MLHSASYGALFGTVGRLLTYGVSRWQGGVRLQSFLEGLISPKDAPNLGTAIAALLVGWSLAHLTNGIINLVDSRFVKLWIVSMYNDGLLRMLYFAMYENEPVALTLTSRKVYIGYVFDLPGESPHDRYLTLMLLLSGYRAGDTMSLIQTVNYANRTVLASTEEESQIFTITLPMDEVASANVFDLRIYEQEFAERLIV